MKIHTTQNLRSSKVYYSTNAEKKLFDQSMLKENSERSSVNMPKQTGSVSFKAKKPLDGFNLLDKAAKKIKKGLT